MLPDRLALVSHDAALAASAAVEFKEQGVEVTGFKNIESVLVRQDCFTFDFYVVDCAQPVAQAAVLIKRLRGESDVGIIAVSDLQVPHALTRALDAGADMYLAKPMPHGRLALAVTAVQRRVAASLQSASEWRLDQKARVLTTPDGAALSLSKADLVVMKCFLEASDRMVPAVQLCQRLGRAEDHRMDNLLHATIYRLRRRISKATTCMPPLQSERGVGYVFRARLIAE